MEVIKNEIQMVEKIELQILGNLQQVKSGNWKEGEKNIETIARKCKASCKSMKAKLQVIEKKMVDMIHTAQQNDLLQRENEQLKADLMKSEILMSSHIR